MSKRSNRPQHSEHAAPSNSHGGKNQGSIPNVVRVSGQVVADLPPGLIEEYKANNKEANTREKGYEGREDKRFNIEHITLAFVVAVAFISGFQAYEAKMSTDAATIAADAARDSVQTTRDQFHLENRAYLSAGDPEEIFNDYFVIKIPSSTVVRSPRTGTICDSGLNVWGKTSPPPISHRVKALTSTSRL